MGLADTVPHTTIPEQTIGALVQHELRWARTIRWLEPLGHALSAVQFPIAWAFAAVLASGGAAWALAIAGGAWAVRARAARAIDRQLGMAGHVPGWTLPLRDLLSVGVIVASYRGRKVRWRGQVVPVGRPLYALARGRTAPYRAAEPALGKAEGGVMMKTLFLQPPSFEGFDGGAGSRYQGAARNQIVLVSDLACATGRAGAGQQAHRCAAGAHRDAGDPAPDRRLRAVRDPHLLAELSQRCEGGDGAQGSASGADRGFRGREGGGAAGRKSARCAGDRFRRAQPSSTSPYWRSPRGVRSPR